MKKWTYIVLHHSLTKDSKTVSWQAIKDYHINVRKWTDIGYHYGIEKINDKYEILSGRPLYMDGAHTKGINDKAIGVCLIGNFDIAPPSFNQWKLAVKLIAGLCVSLKIPIYNINGHNNYSKHKSCPGEYFQIGVFRIEVLELLNKIY